MNPLELFLYLTFLVYAFFYKLPLFIIYVVLILLYILITEVLMRPARDRGDSLQSAVRHKLYASAWKAPSESPIKVS